MTDYRHGLPAHFSCPTCAGFGAVNGGSGYGRPCPDCDGLGRVTGGELDAIQRRATE